MKIIIQRGLKLPGPPLPVYKEHKVLYYIDVYFHLFVSNKYTIKGCIPWKSDLITHQCKHLELSDAECIEIISFLYSGPKRNTVINREIV